MFFSAVPKTEYCVPAPERKFTLSPVQRMYCAFWGMGVTTGGASVSPSVSGKIAEIWLLLSKTVGDVSFLQAVSAVNGVKIAAKAAIHNKFLFFIFVLLKGFALGVNARWYNRRKNSRKALTILYRRVGARSIVNDRKDRQELVDSPAKAGFLPKSGKDGKILRVSSVRALDKRKSVCYNRGEQVLTVRKNYAKIFDGYAHAYNLFARRTGQDRNDAGNGAPKGADLLRGERPF